MAQLLASNHFLKKVMCSLSEFMLKNGLAFAKECFRLAKKIAWQMSCENMRHAKKDNGKAVSFSMQTCWTLPTRVETQ